VKLRTRLAVTVFATMALLFVGALSVRTAIERASVERALIEYATDRMESGGRESCESDPTNFAIGWARWRSSGSSGRPPSPPSWNGDGTSPAPRPPPEGVHEPGRDGGRDSGRESSREGGEGRSPSSHWRWPRIEGWAYASDFTSSNPTAPPFPASLRAELESGERQASDDWIDGDEPGIQVGVRMSWSEGPGAIVLARRGYAPRPIELGGPMFLFGLQCLLLVVAVVLAAGPIVRRVRRLETQMRESAAVRYAKLVDVAGKDEVSELAQTFNAAATEVRANLESIEAREQALRAFVENTTHDVMIPLTVLQGHLTALRRASETNSPLDRSVVVDSLQEAHYMASLIQNLAAAARLEGGKVEFVAHAIDLNALVERAVGRHRPIAKARGISLEHATPPTPLSTRGDVTLVEQAVSNLIHNAVRYVQPGGHVAVVLEEREREFSLRVLDDGPGVPEALRDKVFERSFRADEARSRHPGGMGLGLSIARDVALRHGFTLSLRSPAEGGTELELRGPVQA